MSDTSTLQNVNGVPYSANANAVVGPKTIARIKRVQAVFAARLVGEPIPHDGDAVVLYGRDGVVYHTAHLERHHYDPARDQTHLSYCTQPTVPHLFTEVCAGDSPGDMHTQASGGYWGSVAKARLLHVGVVEKWFWIWGEYGAGGSAGVNIRLRVNQWRFADDRIY
jgi:hypothetical protein